MSGEPAESGTAPIVGSAAASCSELSSLLGEPLAGTAPEASGWLLLEAEGAWGARALAESRLDSELTVELERRAAARSLRVLVIRRHGRSTPARRPPCVYLASSERAGSRLERLPVHDLRQLLDLQLEPGEGEPEAERLFLVCTNGRRDACCARLGRPVAAALTETRGARTWECSHVGGHRFAANLLVLPEGLFFGRLRPASALRVAAGVDEGILDVEHLRGRSSLPAPAQAAEAFLRGRVAMGGTQVPELEQAASEGDTWEIRFRGFPAVRVRSRAAEPPRLESCRGGEAVRPQTWSVVSG